VGIDGKSSPEKRWTRKLTLHTSFTISKHHYRPIINKSSKTDNNSDNNIDDDDDDDDNNKIIRNKMHFEMLVLQTYRYCPSVFDIAFASPRREDRTKLGDLSLKQHIQLRHETQNAYMHVR